MSTAMVLNQKPEVYSTPIKWEYTGLTVVDLWQLMEYFNAHDFAKCLQEVNSYELDLKSHCEEMGDWHKPVVTGWEDKKTNDLLDRVRMCFPPKEFPHTSSVVSRVYGFANSQCTYQELWMRIVALRETMEDELKRRKMVLVKNLKTEYCDKKEAFGENVAKSFPSAERDILDAGNCYALGLDTACVFHLMRVLEKGLRALAAKLNVNYDVENWGRIIERIEAAIAEIDKEARSPEKIARQQFFGECAIEFRHFKNAWRNHVMHAASKYGEDESEKIMEHVKNLMERISPALSE